MLKHANANIPRSNADSMPNSKKRRSNKKGTPIRDHSFAICPRFKSLLRMNNTIIIIAAAGNGNGTPNQ
jgi:hypothetical protein